MFLCRFPLEFTPYFDTGAGMTIRDCMSELIGALPSQTIKSMTDSGYLIGTRSTAIRPASLDLHISSEVYRMRGTFLPRHGEAIKDIVASGALYQLDIAQTPLELNGIYLIRLEESLNLPEAIYAHTNSRSTSGRVNLQTRLLVDGVPQFDYVPRGFKGSLWLEVISKSFPIKLTAGQRLSQMRFFSGYNHLSTLEHEFLYDRYQLFYDCHGEPIPKHPALFDNDGITMSVDLSQDIVGYSCVSTGSKILDFAADSELAPEDFFEPIYRPKNGQLILRRGDFYILHSKELIRIPGPFAAEMIPFDPSKGEFRVHYAGFFDPGFGWGKNGEIKGSTAVFEVFTYDNDFVLRDGQPICKMVYEKLMEMPNLMYGESGAFSHYQQQRGPRLSSHFRTDPPAPTYIELQH